MSASTIFAGSSRLSKGRLRSNAEGARQRPRGSRQAPSTPRSSRTEPCRTCRRNRASPCPSSGFCRHRSRFGGHLKPKSERLILHFGSPFEIRRSGSLSQTCNSQCTSSGQFSSRVLRKSEGWRCAIVRRTRAAPVGWRGSRVLRTGCPSILKSSSYSCLYASAIFFTAARRRNPESSRQRLDGRKDAFATQHAPRRSWHPRSSS